MAAVLRSLRVELAGRDHPVGQAIDEAVAPLLTACERLVRGGRRSSIPPGPPGRDTAAAVSPPWRRCPSRSPDAPRTTSPSASAPYEASSDFAGRAPLGRTALRGVTVPRPGA